MPQRSRLSAALNNGSTVRNHVSDCRRAFSTAGRSATDRIGRIFAISSSSAYMRAIARKNSSPLRGPMTSKNADMATRMLTASGVTGGISSGGSSEALAGARIVTAKAAKPYRNLNAHGRPDVTHPAKIGAFYPCVRIATSHCGEG